MDTHQACDILGINIGDSKEVADKRFRELAAKYHPDKVQDNKDEAEEKFKQISAAYQFIKEHGTEPTRRRNVGPSQEEIRDFFRNAQVRFHQQVIRPKVLVGSVDVSFEESISGCRKPVSFTREIQCPHCKGRGCSKCSNTGLISDLKETEIELPPGVENEGAFARIEGEGGIVQGHIADAILEINVIPDPDLKRSGMDVISNITISLLEALKGTSKETRTAFGKKTLKIRSGIKNGDTVRVRGFGVAKKGSHIFKVRVDYPDDTAPLIEALENYKKPDLEEIEGE